MTHKKTCHLAGKVLFQKKGAIEKRELANLVYLESICKNRMVMMVEM